MACSLVHVLSQQRPGQALTLKRGGDNSQLLAVSWKKDQDSCPVPDTGNSQWEEWLWEEWVSMGSVAVRSQTLRLLVPIW